MENFVLLIDDDVFPMQYHVEAMKKCGLAVCQCTEPDSAIDTLARKGPQILAIILDIMMPTGKTYEKQDTNEGMKTGVFLLRDIKARWPHIPVIVLTNVMNPGTLAECKAELKDYDSLMQKMDCPPFELVCLIERARRQHERPCGSKM
jgi:CheY-like chemotaxis protein